MHNKRDTETPSRYLDTLQTLENQITRLTDTITRLRRENTMLAQQQDNTLKEKNILYDRNYKARKKLEALIIKLKELE